MLRHDVLSTLDVTNGKSPDIGTSGMQFPLPVIGPCSPDSLALRRLAKLSACLVGYLCLLQVALRLHPDAAVLFGKGLGCLLAVAFAVRCLATNRTMPEWPIWAGSGLLALLATAYLGFEIDVLDPALLDHPTSSLSVLVMAVVGAVVLFGYISPTVKRFTTSYSASELLVGFVAAIEAPRFSVDCYVPQSDFGAWNMLPLLLLVAFLMGLLIADQYARFLEVVAASASRLPAKSENAWRDCLEIKCSLSSLFPFLVALWLGNLAFLATITLAEATALGCLTVLVVVTLLSLLQEASLERYRLAWKALRFWITYNIHGIQNPNIFQLRAYCRSPSVRLGLVGIGVGACGLAILHLSGVRSDQFAKTSHPWTAHPGWNTILPQSYPELILESDCLPEAARSIYREHAPELRRHGDCSLPTLTPMRNLVGVAIRVLLAMIGAPLLFLFVLANSQGHFLANLSKRR